MIENEFTTKLYRQLNADNENKFVIVKDNCYICKTDITIDINDISKVKYNKSIVKILLCNKCKYLSNNISVDVNIINKIYNILDKAND